MFKKISSFLKFLKDMGSFLFNESMQRQIYTCICESKKHLLTLLWIIFHFSRYLRRAPPTSATTWDIT